MKDINKKIQLLCPTCGNNQFKSLDAVFEDFYDAPDNVRVQCSDCGLVLTKEEILNENSELIRNTKAEMAKEGKIELEKELNKIFKKWK